MTDTDNMSLRWGRKSARGIETLQYANIMSNFSKFNSKTATVSFVIGVESNLQSLCITISGISHCLAPSTLWNEE